MADRDIARLNIAHFQKLLATDLDPMKRRTIELSPNLGDGRDQAAAA